MSIKKFLLKKFDDPEIIYLKELFYSDVIDFILKNSHSINSDNIEFVQHYLEETFNIDRFNTHSVLSELSKNLHLTIDELLTLLIIPRIPEGEKHIAFYYMDKLINIKKKLKPDFITTEIFEDDIELAFKYYKEKSLLAFEEQYLHIIKLFKDYIENYNPKFKIGKANNGKNCLICLLKLKKEMSKDIIMDIRNKINKFGLYFDIKDNHIRIATILT